MDYINKPLMPTLMEQVTSMLCEGFFKEKDKALLAALQDKGFPSNEEFIKAHMQCITYEEAPEFEHYWYHFGQTEAIRIISFEREPTYNLVQPNDPVVGNWKQTMEAKYF